MWRFGAIVMIWIGSIASLQAQPTYLDRPDLMAMADSCLKHTYGFSFSSARHYQQELKAQTPGHPAPAFLEALILYWEHFPLTPDDRDSERFTGLMDTSISRAIGMMENESTRLEGVFFDLFSRAFKAMFWADNGKPGRVVTDLRTMFKHTKEGFDLKEEFPEFYFSTGLYNYYIEAYPEAHPIYKPLVAFMQDGDRELGLTQLNYAIYHTVFLRVESILFMSLIQLHYENDLNSAAMYAERLHQEYPENTFYLGHLLTILLHQHRFSLVSEILEHQKRCEGIYGEMILHLAEGFLAEQETENVKLSEREYRKVITLADSIGPLADGYTAMGYMGLSRLYEKKGSADESRRFARKAADYTVYSFILDETSAAR